jgi:hypothetical protein
MMKSDPPNRSIAKLIYLYRQYWVRVQSFICLSFFLVAVFAMNSIAEDRCGEIAKNLEQNSLRLREYAGALQKAHKDRDFQLITVLNGQIDETLKQIRVGEAELLNCPATQPHDGPAISSVKSQDTKFADSSCEELKKKYIQLSRKFNSLARRQQSLLSELTSEQKAEYKEAEDSLKAVESELRKRCSPPSAPKPFQRKPHAPVRTIR